MNPKLISSTYIGRHKDTQAGKLFDVFRNIFDNGQIYYTMSATNIISSGFETRISTECPELTYPSTYHDLPDIEIRNQMDHDVTVAIRILKRYANDDLNADLNTDLRYKLSEAVQDAFYGYKDNLPDEELPQ